MEKHNRNRKIIIVGQGATALEYAEYLLDYFKVLAPTKMELFGFLSLSGEQNRLNHLLLELGEAKSHEPDPSFLYLMGCDPSRYYDVLETLRNKGAQFMNFIHPDAKMGSNIELGEGVVVGPFVYIQSGSSIGDFNLLEMYSTVSMFSEIGSFNRLFPKSYVGPECVLGMHNSIGLNANIQKGKLIGNDNRIPAGISL